MTLDSSFCPVEAAKRIKDHFEGTKTLPSAEIVALLFFYIKRYTTFDNFFGDLDEDEDWVLSPSICLSYLLENATPDFRMFLFGVCSVFMPVPIHSRLYFSDTANGRMHTWEESLFIFEKFKSLISFDVFNKSQSLPTRSVEILN
mmetsp:Transcript_2791/g.4376  ORF Transcript_2791/g.4376 Transcript_2791/m.4376 type:complete len:145 (+) Transcript_2791:210-644(+)